MDVDVIIIGAGAAGLIAARDLARLGQSVALLEARDRIGGRLYSIADPSALAPIELGGEFVHGRPAITYELLHELGTTVVDNADGSVAMRDGRLEAAAYDPFDAATNVLATALARDDDESVDALLDRCAVDDRSRAAGRWARQLVNGFDAADTSRASARAIANEWAGDASAGGAQSRPLGGYAPLIAHLVRTLDARLVTLRSNTLVTRVQRDPRGVRVAARTHGRDLEISARHAIVTVPHGVLTAEADGRGAIAFEPPLPPATLSAIGRIAMGPVVKVVLCFRSPVWETLDDARWRDSAFFHYPGAAFPAFWTQLPVRANILVAWAGGDDAQRLAATSDDERIAIALACLGECFDSAAVADAFICAYTHDWQRDSLARGAYSYALVGGERAPELLAVPIDGRLWFAGEATANNGEGGTVAGALASGRRAARAIAASRAELYA